jgi:hypothetical protein
VARLTDTKNNSARTVVPVVVSRNRPFYFTSVEGALANLVDVHNLSRHLVIDLSAFGMHTF